MCVGGNLRGVFLSSLRGAGRLDCDHQAIASPDSWYDVDLICCQCFDVGFDTEVYIQHITLTFLSPEW